MNRRLHYLKKKQKKTSYIKKVLFGYAYHGTEGKKQHDLELLYMESKLATAKETEH